MGYRLHYYNDSVLTNYNYNTTTNRLTSITGSGPLRTYTYNDRGEITGDGTYTYTRNNAGQITAVANVATYAYDGNGNRIKSVVGGVGEYSIYDMSGSLVQTYKPSTGIRKNLLRLEGKTIVELAISGTTETPTYLSVDLLGSPVAFAGSDGYIDDKEVYGPFGEKLNDIDNEIGYTGHAHDYETGLTYAKARFYDAQVGRFLSVDPVAFTAGPFTFNRYAYANNNPYKYKDPNGEFAVAIPVVIGGAIVVGCAVTPSCKQGISDGVAAVVETGASLINKASDALSDAMTAVMNESADGGAKGRAGKDNAPKSDLPRDKSGNYLPDPEAEGAHTTLGTRQGSDGNPYTQGATFDEDGNFTGRTDVTDHGRGDHGSPHFHPATGPNSVGKAEPIQKRDDQ